jgi:signal peptidase I
VTTPTPAPQRSVRPADLDAITRTSLRSEHGRGPHKRGLAGVLEMWGLIILALVLAFVIKTFLVQAFYIPSGSMIPQLEIGDRVLVEKVAYRLREPERGEILVFQRPGSENARAGVRGQARSFLEGLGLAQPDADIDLIKRVIGLPGETVEVREGVVLVNGTALAEDYARPETRSFPPTVVPDGDLFMMGDNRMNSQDSRFPELGTIPIDNVVGRAFVILWPPGRATVAMDRDYASVGEHTLGPAPPDEEEEPATPRRRRRQRNN